MREVEIKGRVIPLLFNTEAYMITEKEVCLIKDFISEIQGPNGTEMTIKLVRIMGNIALQAEGKKPVLTDKWLYANVPPSAVAVYKRAVVEEVADGMTSEHNDEDTGVRDLVLEELNKKKEPES